MSVDESDLDGVWSAARAGWNGGSVVRNLLEQMRLTALTKTHAELTPVDSIRSLAEGKLPECAVLLARVLGREVKCVMNDVPAGAPADVHEASPADGPALWEPPEDHPLVVTVKEIFDAELRDKIAKVHKPAEQEG